MTDSTNSPSDAGDAGDAGNAPRTPRGQLIDRELLKLLECSSQPHDEAGGYVSVSISTSLTPKITITFTSVDGVTTEKEYHILPVMLGYTPGQMKFEQVNRRTEYIERMESPMFRREDLGRWNHEPDEFIIEPRQLSRGFGSSDLEQTIGGIDDPTRGLFQMMPSPPLDPTKVHAEFLRGTDNAHDREMAEQEAQDRRDDEDDTEENDA